MLHAAIMSDLSTELQKTRFSSRRDIVHDFFYSIVFSKMLQDTNFPFLYCDIKSILVGVNVCCHVTVEMCQQVHIYE